MGGKGITFYKSGNYCFVYDDDAEILEKEFKVTIVKKNEEWGIKRSHVILGYNDFIRLGIKLKEKNYQIILR